MKDKYQQYEQSLKFLESLTNLQNERTESKDVFRKFDRLKILLKILGNPQDRLSFIHISGTSGKGSTATFIFEILKQAGFKCGCYRSPYFSNFRERIQVQNKPISFEEVTLLTAKIKKALEKYYTLTSLGSPTYGEIIFCLALTYFAKKKCRYAVIEVGCGGKHDLTNIIANTKAALITNIGHDHLKTLGPSLANVAREKAGIIKPRCLFFTTEKKKRYLQIFQTACQKNQAKFTAVTPLATKIKLFDQGATFTYKNFPYLIKLNGRHQIENAILAIACATALHISPRTIAAGLAKAFIVGRLEIMQSKPLIILDAAHNQEKLQKTIEFVQNIKNQKNISKTWLIFAFTEGKDIQKITAQIFPLFDKIILTRHTHIFRKAIEPYLLINLAKTYNAHGAVSYFLKPQEALTFVFKKAKPTDLVLITGSMYMAGELRQHWFPEK